MILLAVLALATVALPLTGANAQTANTKSAFGKFTASERKATLVDEVTSPDAARYGGTRNLIHYGFVPKRITKKLERPDAVG